MPSFFALAPKGLASELHAELTELGVNKIDLRATGVSFEGSWADCYRVNLWSRVASRVLYNVLEFPAYNIDDLYHNVRKHDFTKYIGPDGAVKVVGKSAQSAVRDQRMLTLKIKDAIVDQFREKFGRRPNVDKESPDLTVFAHSFKSQVTVSIDTSGDPLFQRGYRRNAGAAPMKENLAAALVRWADLLKYPAIIDPFCGSGTFLIEAALAAQNSAPGLSRSKFAFERWQTFQKKEWEKLVDQAVGAEREDTQRFFGFDRDRSAISNARENIHRAGVEDLVAVFRKDVLHLYPEEGAPAGALIMNPPYGERMADRNIVADLYRDLGFVLRSRFSGWTAYIVSGDGALTRHLMLKAERKVRFYNGPIECRMLQYLIR